MGSFFPTVFKISGTGSTMQFGQVSSLAKLQAALVSRSAIVGSLTRAQIVNSMYDRFVNANGIDGSSVYTYGAGYCGPVEAVPPTQTWAATLTSDEGSNWAASMGTRTLHAAGNISTSGSQVRVTIQAAAAYQSNFTHVCFAENAGSGNAAGVFGSSKFKEFLFSGATGKNIAAGGSAVSDWLAFDVDESKNYMTIIGFPATNANVRDGSGDGTYGKAGASGEYTTQNISGYTSYGSAAMCVSKLEVQTIPQNMVLISNPVTSSRVASQARAVALIKNIDASTKLYVSSATSPSWTELTNLTLDTAHIGGPGVNLYVSDIVAIPYSADKSMRWKVETDAGHSTRCYGVALNWI